MPLYTLRIWTIDTMINHIALYLMHLIDDHGYQRVNIPQPELEMIVISARKKRSSISTQDMGNLSIFDII